MGKAEVGTPKWIGNKIKAKGLQKLRWYCQVCDNFVEGLNIFYTLSHLPNLLCLPDVSETMPRRKWLQVSHDERVSSTTTFDFCRHSSQISGFVFKGISRRFFDAAQTNSWDQKSLCKHGMLNLS